MCIIKHGFQCFATILFKQESRVVGKIILGLSDKKLWKPQFCRCISFIKGSIWSHASQSLLLFTPKLFYQVEVRALYSLCIVESSSSTPNSLLCIYGLGFGHWSDHPTKLRQWNCSKSGIPISKTQLLKKKSHTTIST